MNDLKQTEQIFFVTHFITQPAPQEGYTKLSYMTATADSLRKEIYYMGFGIHRPFDQTYLEAKIKSGSLIKLPAPHKITRSKGLWMNTQEEVFIADKNDPFTDTNIQSVYKKILKYTFDNIELRGDFYSQPMVEIPVQIQSLYENTFWVDFTGTKKLSRESFNKRFSVLRYSTIEEIKPLSVISESKAFLNQ